MVWSGSVLLRGPHTGVVSCGIPLLVLIASAAPHLIAGTPQSAATAPNLTPAATLPATCQSVAKADPKTAAIWDALTSHPAADVYNALGALYAGKGNVACAIPAFEAALRIDPHRGKLTITWRWR